MKSNTYLYLTEANTCLQCTMLNSWDVKCEEAWEITNLVLTEINNETLPLRGDEQWLSDTSAEVLATTNLVSKDVGVKMTMTPGSQNPYAPSYVDFKTTWRLPRFADLTTGEHFFLLQADINLSGDLVDYFGIPTLREEWVVLWQVDVPTGGILSGLSQWERRDSPGGENPTVVHLGMRALLRFAWVALPVLKILVQFRCVTDSQSPPTTPIKCRATTTFSLTMAHTEARRVTTPKWTDPMTSVCVSGNVRELKTPGSHSTFTTGIEAQSEEQISTSPPAINREGSWEDLTAT